METEHEKRKRFVMFSEDLLKATYLNSAEKLLFIILLRRARQDGFLFVSIDTLIGETGFCNKTIIKMLRHFEEVQLIYQQPMILGVKNVGTIRYINREHPLLTFNEDERSEACIPERKFVPCDEDQSKAMETFNKWCAAHQRKKLHGFGEI